MVVLFHTTNYYRTYFQKLMFIAQKKAFQEI